MLSAFPSLCGPEDGVAGREVIAAPAQSANAPICDGCVSPDDRRGIVVAKMVVPPRAMVAEMGHWRRARNDVSNKRR